MICSSFVLIPLTLRKLIRYFVCRSAAEGIRQSVTYVLSIRGTDPCALALPWLGMQSEDRTSTGRTQSLIIGEPEQPASRAMAGVGLTDDRMSPSAESANRECFQLLTGRRSNKVTCEVLVV